MNYILQYTGANNPNLSAVKESLSAEHINVLDDSLLPSAALVELDEADVERVRNDFKNGWVLVPEQTFRIPSTRKKILK